LTTTVAKGFAGPTGRPKGSDSILCPANTFAHGVGSKLRSLPFIRTLPNALKSSKDLAQAILSFGTAVVEVPKLCSKYHLSIPQFVKIFDRAEQDGLVTAADELHELYQLVALTPLAAELLKVKLDWYSARWVSERTRFAGERKFKRTNELRTLADVMDRQTLSIESGEAGDNASVSFVDLGQEEPWVKVSTAESIARFDREERRGDDPFRPKPARVRHLVNIARQWPIVGDCCQGIDLKYGEYCAWCDRGGEDSLIDLCEEERQRNERMRRIKSGEDDVSPV
jgi:hypothetical protein